MQAWSGATDGSHMEAHFTLDDWRAYALKLRAGAAHQAGTAAVQEALERADDIGGGFKNHGYRGMYCDYCNQPEDNGHGFGCVYPAFAILAAEVRRLQAQHPQEVQEDDGGLDALLREHERMKLHIRWFLESCDHEKVTVDFLREHFATALPSTRPTTTKDLGEPSNVKVKSTEEKP
jgi:hypothetical protein